MTDTVTGLIWLKQADCLADNDWAAANEAAAGLKDGDCGGLDGRVLAGRLAVAHQGRVERDDRARGRPGLHFGSAGGPPSLTNDAGTACYSDGSVVVCGRGVGRLLVEFHR